jgi:membrane protease subunit (stomatin/prohibitin family)
MDANTINWIVATGGFIFGSAMRVYRNRRSKKAQAGGQKPYPPERPRTIQLQPSKFCINCGAKILKASKFCTACGANQE